MKEKDKKQNCIINELSFLKQILIDESIYIYMYYYYLYIKISYD